MVIWPLLSLSLYTIRKYCQWSQKPQSAHKDGFLLIEVLFSVLFLSLFSLIIAYYQGNVIYTQYESLHRLQAISRASQLIDHIMAQSKLPETIPNQPDTTFFISLKRLPSTMTGFLPFTITVSWVSQSEEKKFVTLYSGVVDVQKNE